jgi:hypothetical protein
MFPAAAKGNDRADLYAQDQLSVVQLIIKLVLPLTMKSAI